MTVVLSTVTLPNVNNLPADEFVNSFVFEASNLGNAIAVAQAALPDVYNGTSGGGVSIASQLSAVISRAAGTASIKTYDITAHLDGSPHGTPADVFNFTLAAGSSATGLPEEVALCLSFHGAFGSLLEIGAVDTAIPSDEEAIDEGAPATHTGRDRPKSRLRGRIFFGPFHQNTFAAASPFRPSTALQSAVGTAGTRLQALVGANWRVWSRRNASVITVSSAFVDNAWDTQRRRGLKASGRTSY